MAHPTAAWLAAGFSDIALRYHGDYPSVVLMLVDRHGVPTTPPSPFPCAPCGMGPAQWRGMVHESLRWGEPSLGTCPEGHYVWAVPLSINQELVGGILAAYDRRASGPPDAAGAVNAAAEELLRAAVEHNLANAALLRENRQGAEREASKACAIHSLKETCYTTIRETCLHEEEALHAAIRARDRGQARETLNRILVAVYAVGTQDLDLLKAMVLEFMIIIYRAAVEAGGDPMAMLGLNHRSYLNLFRIYDEEQLAHWLVEHLEQLMDCLDMEPKRPPEARLQQAVRFVREHFTEELGRDQVAAAVHLSPSHFSHLLRERMGTTFRDLVNEMRIARACELLAHSERSLADIALEVGFADQSHFTKAFRRRQGTTPREYRLASGRRGL